MLITGATDGLGRALARAADDAGATVLVHGRSEERIAATLEELSDRARAYQADLASLAEVKRLADEVLAAEDRLDVLVNNAGIGTNVPGGGSRQESADGVELRFAVNYLAGYALTHRLLDLLKRSAPSRIVNVSSAGQAPIDFDDVMLERSYDGQRAYAQSKLAQVMSTFDLAERLRDAGVTVNALHPSTYMPTKMVLHARGSGVDSLEAGVAATVRLACAGELGGVTGRYFNRTAEARADEQAYDPAARRRLWELSERLTGLS